MLAESAQCRSSSSTTTGARSASPSSSFRTSPLPRRRSDSGSVVGTALRPSSPTAKPSQVATVSGAPSAASCEPSSRAQPSRHFSRTRSGASVARMPRRSANTLRSSAFGTFSVDGEARPRSTQTLRRQAGQPGVDVVHQPRLADAGLAEHGDDPPGALADDGGVGVLELAQVLLAADRAGDDALDAAGLGPVPLAVAGDDDVGVDRAVDALELQPRHPAQPELAGHLPGGVGRQQHGAGPGRGLQPGGAVGGLADDQELAGLPLGHPGDDHLAGVDAHPHLQVDPERGADLPLSSSSAASMASAARTARVASSSFDR